MNIEYGLVAGYLFAWGVKRAKSIGDKADANTDKAFQDALTRLEAVVRDCLGNNEAMEDLDEAINAAADDNSAVPTALSDDTHDALVRSLKRAAKKDPDFATTLAEALTAVRAADPTRTANNGVTLHHGYTAVGSTVGVIVFGVGTSRRAASSPSEAPNPPKPDPHKR